ncbi:TetR family transcriptional regulator [Actinoplanes sp. SE50]|uniref:TetR/AcrR family transcriptional regulator n=1 Tax=unclassified Actinoplanes TaxID=2626549 RepID=UPI00023EC2EE|nr:MULTISPECIES: TetR/AcrR family transcriptional regulator [unclassified Actinoplanes]AEV85814.1 Tetracycline repressor protein class G [Actinoplanes sp. SE50/110]ATO84208.1 TetR family transcriptional regulator [Actinoplanes sp. SE50]SLM01618.1 TetR family transcriptional regulator [Actinoplanes sp. SE50/110]
MATTRGSSGRVRRRPTRSGVILEPSMIIDAALRLIEAPGGNALTVRRLGVELGADPSAIYRYFRDLDALLIAIADRLISETLAGFESGPDWRAALREMGRGVHDSMLRHPRLATLRASRFTAGPNELRADDIGIGLLLRAGFPAPDAVRHFRDFIDAVLALAAMDAAELAPGQEEADRQALAQAYATFSPEEYPNLAAVREHLPQIAVSAFPGVLDKLVDAIAVQLPAS